MAAFAENLKIALDALYGVIDELNAELPPDKQLAKHVETRIFGEDQGLDSLDLVRLVVLYEQAISESTQQVVSISDDRAMSEQNSHFRTVDSLSQYVAALLSEGMDVA